MKIVLDTNAVSALMRGDAAMLARLAQVRPGDVSVPQPVFAELLYGIRRLPRSRRRDALAERLALVMGQLKRASWNDAVSEAFGDIKAALERGGKRIEDFDAAIAAHAKSSGARLVTANTKQMARVPHLDVEDWGG